MELYSFLSYALMEFNDMQKTAKFPSPYGVIFILIFETLHCIHNLNLQFPSPYGVIFILILVTHQFKRKF